MLSHTGDRPFPCTWKNCKHACQTEDHLKVHMRTHTGEKPFRCTEKDCSFALSSSTSLKNHIAMHRGEKTHKCTWKRCDYAAITKQAVKEHYKRTQRKETTSATGQIVRPNLLRAKTEATYRIHKVKRPYGCDWPSCSYAARTSDQLKDHKLTHTKQRDFKCDQKGCDYAAARKVTLALPSDGPPR